MSASCIHFWSLHAFYMIVVLERSDPNHGIFLCVGLGAVAGKQLDSLQHLPFLTRHEIPAATRKETVHEFVCAYCNYMCVYVLMRKRLCTKVNSKSNYNRVCMSPQEQENMRARMMQSVECRKMTEGREHTEEEEGLLGQLNDFWILWECADVALF